MFLSARSKFIFLVLSARFAIWGGFWSRDDIAEETANVEIHSTWKASPQPTDIHKCGGASGDSFSIGVRASLAVAERYVGIRFF